MKTRWMLAVIVSLILTPSLAHAAPCANLSGPADVTEDFEAINTNQAGGEVFVLGTVPGTATFSGQQWAGIAFIGELYFSGAQAWMVLPNGVGTMTFDPPASEVLFQGKTLSTSTGDTLIETFDSGDTLIDMVTLPAGMPAGVPASAGFQQVCLTGSIASIDVTNNDGLAMNAIDDFAYIVPEPAAALSAAACLGSLLVVAAGRRRRPQRGV